MHTCPDCGRSCTCGGDIDDINFGDELGCVCTCADDWDDMLDDSEADDWDDDGEPEVRAQPDSHDTL